MLRFHKITLRNLKQLIIEHSLRKKLQYPSHLQLSFYADFLESFSSSSEQSIFKPVQFYSDLTWEEKDVPGCFTAVNSGDNIRGKRVVVIVWISNEMSQQEVIGYCNLKLDCLEQ